MPIWYFRDVSPFGLYNNKSLKGGGVAEGAGLESLCSPAIEALYLKMCTEGGPATEPLYLKFFTKGGIESGVARFCSQ